MPMCNLLEYSSNFSYVSSSLWFCPKEEATNFNVNITDGNNSKSFSHKSKLLGNAEADEAN